YTDQTLDAVLSPYDPISLGIISSLKGVGYGSESKPLPVITGQTSFSQIATLRWDGSTAQARMDNLLSANYTDQTLDAVLSP
ncbi:hypothetical protein NGC61_13570, partial [Enterococcus faecium]|nr:hypothetical protein [Enterococcus faecium]